MDFKLTVLMCGFADYFKYPHIKYQPKTLPKWLSEKEEKLYLKGWEFAKLQCSGS